MFESPTGFERNKKVQLIGFIALLCCIIWFVISTRRNEVPTEAVNGVYRNQCCDNIIIRDGRLFYRGKSFAFRLFNMKYGLVGDINARFTGHDIQESAESTEIEFLNPGTQPSLSVRIDQNDDTFRLVQPLGPPS